MRRMFYNTRRLIARLIIALFLGVIILIIAVRVYAHVLFTYARAENIG